MLRQRENGIWYADISIAGKPRITKSCFTKNKKQAQEYHDKLTAEAWRVTQLKEQPKHTWMDAVALWLKIKGNKRSIEDDKDKLRWLDKYLGKQMLNDIDGAMLTRISDAKLADGVAEATVNRYMALVRSVMNLAQAHSLMGVPPSFKGRICREDTERVIYMTKEQANHLMTYLPASLQAPYKFALTTGLRRSNVFGLKWNQIDVERKCAWIVSADAKGKQGIAIPLNSTALDIINSRHADKDKSVYLFGGLHAPEHKAWKRYLRLSGVGESISGQFGVGLRWHDLRHTWATWHVMAGTPLEVLQKMGGWKSYKMVQKYAHFTPAHLAQYSENAGF